MVGKKKIFDGQRFYPVMRVLGGVFFKNLRAKKLFFSGYISDSTLKCC